MYQHINVLIYCREETQTADVSNGIHINVSIYCCEETQTADISTTKGTHKCIDIL